MNKGLFVLVMGNTGTGKSHFIKTLNDRKNRVIIINDDYPSNDGILLIEDVSCALRKRKTVILEGNYTSRYSRSILLSALRSNTLTNDFICFNFGPGNKDSLKRRLSDTTLNKEKVVEVNNNYLKEYEEPVIGEGFREVFKCF